MSRPSAKLLADFYELVDRLSATRSLTESLDEILDASLKLIHADAGIIRLYNESEENFSVVAQRGFGSEHVALVESLAPRLFSEGPSSHAFLTKERVIVEDLTSHPFVATHREAYEESGVVALQVTPLITRTQLAIGTISTYFREARVPNAEALHLLDLYARLATDTIEREQNLSERLASEAALKQSERRFRR
ncbi:MAG: GAF domain-containing protein, partial [Dehalococcoidia bacterium]